METELKFQVPAARHAEVRRAVASASAYVRQVTAIYFDTRDRRLAAAGLALRLRSEDGRWDQALKGQGDGVLHRLEHEVGVPARRGAPEVDPARHAGSAAGAKLASVLASGPDGGRLQEVFRTAIRRTCRHVSHAGATIEVAFDEGELRAGTRRAAVAEIEFEHVAGPIQALPIVAAQWARRFGLWWDVRTKAERGHRLASGTTTAAPVRAVAHVLDPQHAPGEAFGAIVRACLAHALPNLAEIADGAGTTEHLHQLRVALRRLRSALRELADWSAEPAAARALDAAWRAPFTALGATRDADAVGDLLAAVLPAPAAAQVPAALARGTAGAPAALVRADAVQHLLLRTLHLALAAPPVTAPPLVDAATVVLARCRRRALAGAARFERRTPSRQHQVRRRIKRLRYAFDFLTVLYPARAAHRLARRLAAASEALGRLHDLQVALQACDCHLGDGDAVAQARRALRRRRRGARHDAAQALRRAAAAPQPWDARRAAR